MRLNSIAPESFSEQPHGLVATAPIAPSPSPIAAKQAIRTSLRASTLDGVFAAVFSTITSGVLLSNFLVELHASPTEIGLLSSIPMVANLIQPLGAFLGDRVNSRHNYCLWVYAPSRLLWLVLVAGIAFAHWWHVEAQRLVWWTLAIVCLTHFIGALGSAVWLSWLAALVPRRLRGRYFGIRNSAASLTNLLCVPLLGLAVSAFPGGSLQAFGVVLLLGVVAGIISLGFQFLMVDVNPQRQQEEEGSGEWGVGSRESGSRQPSTVSGQETANSAPLVINPIGFTGEAADTDGRSRQALITDDSQNPHLISLSTPYALPPFLRDKNFLFFLLYFSGWMFAVNLSAPFFNLYMLDNLAIDVSWVTIYTSLQAGATLVMLVVWGRLADRVGNRPILLAVGILVAVTPLFWLGTGANTLSVWLWLPLLHVIAGATWAAIDLCNNNLQLGVAPVQQQASYFAVAAAIAGISGALGTTVGGFLAEFADYGGIPGLFALSAIVRLVALLPLVLVHEQRGQSLHQMMQVLFPSKAAPALETVPAYSQAVLLKAQLDDATHCTVDKSVTMEE
ncbi:MFS transporter [Stenomitos frigidus]|uniref:MFS transporter n=1 Tax=Stenomitos frigidus TaxID=1886765 RepID=UPI001FE7A96C|nr:MFS transporter [Stenomitos frigidus]